MDTVDRATRSRMMSSIRSVSRMECAVACAVSRVVGCRLRHQPGGIEGRPDFANKARKVAVFVHGCFWHQPCPRRCSKLPASNRHFWRKKFARNRERHREVAGRLRRAGWAVWTLWEHDKRLRGLAGA